MRRPAVMSGSYAIPERACIHCKSICIGAKMNRAGRSGGNVRVRAGLGWNTRLRWRWSRNAEGRLRLHGACARRPLCVIRRLLQAPLQLAIVIFFAVVSSSLGYGPLGHEIVGAIADRKLAGTPTAAKIKTLLDGIPLERASLIADDMKSLDKIGPDDRRRIHFLALSEMEQQLQ